MKRSLVILAALMLILALSVSFASAANPPQPTYGVADVDGDTPEWNIAEDFFANMHEAGRISKPILSKLYLRYDCANEVLYALVSLEDGNHLNWDGIGEHYIKVYNSKMVDETYGDNNDPPDFAYLDVDDPNAEGWEASILLPKNETYLINIHTQVDTDGGPSGRTSATTPDDRAKNREIPLVTDCEETAITLSAFDAEIDHRNARVTWETGTEVDNFGFNIYRSTSVDGPWNKLNDALISIEGDAVSGGSYEFTDRPGYGTFYYYLEDVDANLEKTTHAPVMVKFGSPIRAPKFRPNLPEF